MCDHAPATDTVAAPAAPNAAPVAAHAKPTFTGSRRRRLWEMGHECHCPVVGVCLPLDTLRRLVNKVCGGKTLVDDYDVHVGAVSECTHRNRLSEALQGELDRRYALDVQRFKSAKTTLALSDLWAQAVRKGDVAGAFWAALAHPRCDAPLQEVLCRDMHMLQHQAGAMVRVDIAKFNAVLDENAVLARELGRAQERSTRLLAEKSTELAQVSKLHVRAQAECVAKDSRIGYLTDDLAALKASNPNLETVARLQKRLDQMQDRQTELEAQNQELRHKLATASRALETLAAELPQAARVPARPDAGELVQPQVSPVTLYLNQKNVLCVGGRSGNVASYRDVVERTGARFAHHDGGLEDNVAALESSMAAADMVICQTGCISHNAYWRVKDYCKRTGKRCLFVENPSTSSLERGLNQALQQAPVPDGTAVPSNG